MEIIYIVEDDVNIREIESCALKNSGYEVKEFECSKDLFECLNINIPSLVILDIVLSNENGMDILAKIRSNKKTENIPVIIVTAKATDFDKIKGLDSGADDYITKPFGVMEFVSRVKALIRRTRNV